MTDRLLVMRGGALGDFLLGLPALRALRQAFPEASLELVAPAAVLPLAHWLADTLTPLERAEMASLFGDSEALPEEILRRYEGLDLVVLWLADREGSVRANFQRLGARRTLWAPALPTKAARHATDHLLETLRPLGIIPEDGEATSPGDVGAAPRGRPEEGDHTGSPLQAVGSAPLVRPREPAREVAAALWNRWGLEPGGPVVAIHPGSGGRWKTWRPERFAEVADRLADLGAQVVLIQGPADEKPVRQVLANLRRQSPLVVAGLAVEELAAFLSRCAAYLGNDSGVTHLAATLGVPTLALFGPTDPATWAPRGPRVLVLDSGSRAEAALTPTLSQGERGRGGSRARKPALWPVCGLAGSGVSPDSSTLTTTYLDAIEVQQVLEALKVLTHKNQ